VGSPDYLVETLERAGWRPPAAWNSIGAIAWLAMGSGMEALPVLPKLHEGRTPRLMLNLFEEGGRTRLVLRLWDSGFRLKSFKGSPPLWLATVTREDLEQPLGIVSLAVTEKDADSPRDVLARTIPALTRKRIDPPQGDAQWDGVLMLTAGGS
jgi:undecaprenyl-diphosphatase